MICISSSWRHCHPSSLASVKSRMIYLSGASLPRLSWKKAVKRVCVCVLFFKLELWRKCRQTTGYTIICTHIFWTHTIYNGHFPGESVTTSCPFMAFSFHLATQHLCTSTSEHQTNKHMHNRFSALWTLSSTTRVSRYQKVKPGRISLDLLEQEIVSGSGISWAYANLHLAPDRQPR